MLEFLNINKEDTKEIDALLNTLSWIESFDIVKDKLTIKEKEIEALEDKMLKANEKMSIYNEKRINKINVLELNKKLTEEMVLNTFTDKKFIDKFHAVPITKIKKETLPAYNYVEEKYKEYKYDYIDSLIK